MGSGDGAKLLTSWWLRNEKRRREKEGIRDKWTL
jgi:hypothetical protein